MKKVAVLTLNGNNNFGNRLQNYALVHFLEKIGTDPVSIWLYPSNKLILKKYLKTILGIFIKKYRVDKRRKKISNFNKKYIKTLYIVKNKLYKIDNNYDFFVVGSDQVWNPDVAINRHYYFLPFTNANKKIAYAASLGKEKISKEYELVLKKYLSIDEFKNISVREAAGAKILKKVLKRNDIEVLIDPTMLLTKEEWQKIEKKPDNYNGEKYILNYFLGKLNDNKNNEIRRIAEEKGYKVINILDKDDPYYNSGVEEFLYLENHASLICTDSFHSCVFAFLFSNPFIVFDRDEVGMNDMGSRIDNLLSTFKLESCKYDGKIKESQLKCDFKKSYEILDFERNKSRNYLLKNLK